VEGGNIIYVSPYKEKEMPNISYYHRHLEEQRAKGREYYWKNRERELRLRNEFNHTDRGKELRDKKKEERKAMLDKIKSDNGCIICGEKAPCCLDFHHINPSDKKYGLSQIRQTGSIETIMEEVSKCVVVCRNCHAKIHAGKIKLPV
jgi:hypothetical protein